MDNLKTLMDKKEYELVIKLTKSSIDINDLFYRISAFLALGKAQDALNTIEEHHQILEKDLNLLIKVHIEILCLLSKFDEAREKLKYYENLPYQSQVVEETLRAMPDVIKEEEKKLSSFKYLSDEQLSEKLHSKDNSEVLLALDILKSRDVLSFLNDIYPIMINNTDQLIRSFALLLLVQKEVDREVRFNHNGEIKVYNPKHLKPPFTGDDFNGVIKLIQSKFKDTSLSENAVSILLTFILYTYPDSVNKYDVKVLLSALYVVSREYMQDPIKNLKEYSIQENVDELELQDLINKINLSLESK